jgi:hypothetical protein
VLFRSRMMMDQLYAPLLKQLGLTPEESAKFKDLLADNMSKATEKASSLFSGLSATNHAELASAMAADQKTFDEQVKSLLGDDRYAQYKDYQLTVGERTQLNLFRQQTGTDNPLSDQQTEQLLTLMKEEKQNASANGQTLSGLGQDQAGLQAMLSDEQAEKLLQSQQDISQRVYDRARSILSPEQMDSFGTFQTNQLQMMRLGIGMARKLMAPAKTEAGAPAAGQ